MSRAESSGELNATENNEQAYEEEEDGSGDETENEDIPEEASTSRKNSSTLTQQFPTLCHELTNPILECLANIEIPYRCLYMSCSNFYPTKSLMLNHMRCDHGLEINLMPSVNCNIESRLTSLKQQQQQPCHCRVTNISASTIFMYHVV